MSERRPRPAVLHDTDPLRSPRVEILLERIRAHHHQARIRLGCTVEPLGRSPDAVLYLHGALPWRYFNHAAVSGPGARDRPGLVREVIRRMLEAGRPAVFELELPIQPLLSRQRPGFPRIRPRDPLQSRISGWVDDLKQIGFSRADDLIVMTRSAAGFRDAADRGVPAEDATCESPEGFHVQRMDPGAVAVQVEVHSRGFEMIDDLPDAMDHTLVQSNLTGGVEYFWAIEDASAQPVGSTALYCLGKTAEIFALSVVPERRGRGIGRMLAQHAMRQAAARDCDLVYLQAEPGSRAIALYERLGFTRVWRQAAYVYL